MTHNHPFVHKKLFQYIAWAMPLLYPTLIDADPPDWSHQIHVWFQGQFLAVLDPIGAPWLPRWPTWPTKLFLCITTDAQWLLPPLFHTVPPDWSHQTNLWPKRTFLASLDFLCTLWCPWMTPYDPQNCCKGPPRMFPNVLHPYSKLFHQIVATIPACGPKRSFLALFV